MSIYFCLSGCNAWYAGDVLPKAQRSIWRTLGARVVPCNRRSCLGKPLLWRCVAGGQGQLLAGNIANEEDQATSPSSQGEAPEDTMRRLLAYAYVCPQLTQHPAGCKAWHMYSISNFIWPWDFRTHKSKLKENHATLFHYKWSDRRSGSSVVDLKRSRDISATASDELHFYGDNQLMMHCMNICFFVLFSVFVTSIYLEKENGKQKKRSKKERW